MYMGITAHRNAKTVRSFADAEAALKQAMTTPTGRTRKPRADGMFPLGLTKRGQTAVGEQCDGIAFRLYQTDVVVWHPDNSVTIENYGTVTTSDFAKRFSPEGISLSRPMCKRGEEFGHRGFTYRPPVKDGDWRASWAEARVCFGAGNTVRFVQDGDRWVPDQDTLVKIVFPELNVGHARDMAKQLHLRDFERWLAMAPHHMDIDHEEFDASECEHALVRRDFRQAACFLPALRIPNGFGAHDRITPLPIRVRDRDTYIGLGSIAKLKLALWEERGYLRDHIVTDIGAGEFERRMTRVRQLDALGYEGTYGPPR